MMVAGALAAARSPSPAMHATDLEPHTSLNIVRTSIQSEGKPRQS